MTLAGRQNPSDFTQNESPPNQDLGPTSENPNLRRKNEIEVGNGTKSSRMPQKISKNCKEGSTSLKSLRIENINPEKLNIRNRIEKKSRKFEKCRKLPREIFVNKTGKIDILEVVDLGMEMTTRRKISRKTNKIEQSDKIQNASVFRNSTRIVRNIFGDRVEKNLLDVVTSAKTSEDKPHTKDFPVQAALPKRTRPITQVPVAPASSTNAYQQEDDDVQEVVPVKSEPISIPADTANNSYSAMVEKSYTSDTTHLAQEGIVADPNMEYGEEYGDYEENYVRQEGGYEGAVGMVGQDESKGKKIPFVYSFHH